MLAAALLVVAAGCSGTDGAEEQSAAVDRTVPPVTMRAALEGPYPGAGVDCPTAEPSPITVAEARRSLRAHGFAVGELERSCGLRLISAMLTNATSGPLAANVHEREGLVTCFVFATRRPGVPDAIEGDTTAASAQRRLANLQCNLSGADALGFDREVARLDRAFERLRRGIRP